VAQRRANRRCAALSRSVRLSAGLGDELRDGTGKRARAKVSRRDTAPGVRKTARHPRGLPRWNEGTAVRLLLKPKALAGASAGFRTLAVRRLPERLEWRVFIMRPQAERQRRLTEARAGCWRAEKRRRSRAAAERAAACAGATRFLLATALDNEFMADGAQRGIHRRCAASSRSVPWNDGFGVIGTI